MIHNPRQDIRELKMGIEIHTISDNLKSACNVVFDPKDGTR